MTLNITAADRYGAHQVADLRLFNPVTGKGHDSDIGKQQRCGTCEYQAVISYAGLARWKAFDTPEWLNDLLVERSSGSSFEEMLEVIRAKATEVIRVVPHKQSMLRSLTFSVGAVVEGAVRLCLISNIDKLDGIRLPEPADELFIQQSTPKRPRVVATGIPLAVSREQRRRVLRALDARSDPLAIRELLRDVNQETASLDDFKNVISPECLAYSLMVDGQGAGGRFGGDVNTPHAVFEGFDLRAMMLDMLEKWKHSESTGDPIEAPESADRFRRPTKDSGQ